MNKMEESALEKKVSLRLGLLFQESVKLLIFMTHFLNSVEFFMTF